ncbi:signal recognition particle, SRP19 subunit, partial [Blastocladiella britannica]
RQMKRFLIIYPAYFDAKRSVANGRRVPAKLAYEEPTVWHIAKALERIGFPGVIEVLYPIPLYWPGRPRTYI